MTDLGTEPTVVADHRDAKAQAKAAKAYAKATRPWYKKKRFLLPIAIVAVAAMANAGSGDDSPTPSSDVAVADSGNAGDTAPKAATADSDEPGLGEAVRDGKFEFTVKGVDCGKKRIGPAAFGVKAQGQFCLVNVKVENIGDEAQSMFGDNQLMFDQDGREFSADTEAAIYLDSAQTIWEEINPGNSINGVVVFDVPKDAKPAQIELHDSMFSGGVTVSLSK